MKKMNSLKKRSLWQAESPVCYSNEEEMGRLCCGLRGSFKLSRHDEIVYFNLSLIIRSLSCVTFENH